MEVKFSSAPKSVIENHDVDNGKIYVSSDTRELFCDTPDGERIRISDIEFLNKESDRIGLLAPLNKFYFVIETNQLWYYNSVWRKMCPGIDDGVVE